MNFNSTRIFQGSVFLIALSLSLLSACGGGAGGGSGWGPAGSAGDQTAPTVKATSPVTGASGVAVSATITTTFSEAMTESTVVNTTNFTLSHGASSVAGAVSYSDTTATFTPFSNLDYSTTYTATITTDVKDAANNAIASPYTWTFTTGTAADNIPPTVTTISPLNSASGVSVSAPITATFSETLKTSTVNPTNFTLVNGANSVEGAVSYSGTTATFTPNSQLAYSATYTATITTGVQDTSNNPIAVPYIWTFRTQVPPINDTGITYSQCYQAASDVLVNCRSSAAIELNPAQDGMVGRDANAADGKSGFSFTTVTVGADNCVQDNVTGLMWEVKTADSGWRDRNKLYSNKGDNSVGDDSTFVTAVNATNLCGFNDWRLPSADELQSIVNYSIALPGPTIDASAFPNTYAGIYWSVSPYVSNSAFAWYVIFSSGAVNGVYDYYSYSVRLVRAGPTQAAPHYTVSTDGKEVTDNQTNLIWRRCVEGMSWNGTTCTGTASTYTHEVALQQAASQASSTGIAWRLPNAMELSSIANRSVINPAIDPAVFPSTPIGTFWSSTPYVNYSSYALVVHFDYGNVLNSIRTESDYVRLVRFSQ